ncbi:MAG: M23 family metallopeptidase [Clostridia bacterium]|nr:M23 family metallopeptidase [Clostridia bacterium]
MLVALVVLLPLVFGKGAPKLSAAEPRVIITPEPKAEEDAVKIATPVPTPVHIIETATPYLPRSAVNLLVNGTPIFAVDSREAAEQLVHLYLNECAFENLEDNAVLLKAAIDAELSTVPADGSVEYCEFDVALNRLRKNRSLIPVHRTVERAVITVTPFDTRVETTKLLPEGTRIFRRIGVAARSLSLSETLFIDGMASSDTETLNVQVLTASDERVLNGTVRIDAVITDPYYGHRGPDAPALSFRYPIRGALSGYFGPDGGVMRWGIDFTAAPGTRVFAPESGTIVFVGERKGYGPVVEIRHENGFISRLSPVRTQGLLLEQHVSAGDPIGVLPEIERSTTATLHYELLIDGVPYNPMLYLPEK